VPSTSQRHMTSYDASYDVVPKNSTSLKIAPARWFKRRVGKPGLSTIPSRSDPWDWSGNVPGLMRTGRSGLGLFQDWSIGRLADSADWPRVMSQLDELKQPKFNTDLYNYTISYTLYIF
jgi:hypothetical protein